ncbi:hypothetical protein [Terrisporobacter sp.]|uniref:hypothetical protein n=1 Tax=Terrisporobacter sp. TaxID=1965305 RepID=UPI00262B6DD7|nr:hypothetical protein [Terrisporobacter sp.]
MLWNKCLLYKGLSKKEYNEVIDILELNHIKYTDKVINKNKDIGPMIDKIMVGTDGSKEDFSYEYSVFVSKNDFEYANSLIKYNMS